MQSIPDIADVEIFGGAGPLDLVIEIPHGATRTRDFERVAAQLTSVLPANLVDFFHVNTDAGAPELGVATAKRLAGKRVAIVRCRIPRTFIDCNRRMDASAEDFKAGKVTPGLMPWITSPEDRRLLRTAYDRYVGVVAETVAALASDGAMLLLHTYAPRTVGVEIGPDIVTSLHAAYAPDVEPTWPLRPEIDVIGTTLDGTSHVPTGVIDAFRAAVPFEVADGKTYPLHPSTLAYDHVMAHPGRAVCIEVRRDLLADPFVPFAEMQISAQKVDRIAVPLAAALATWW